MQAGGFSNSLDQQLPRNRLGEIGCAADVHRFLADRVGILPCHKNDGNLRTRGFQPAPHLDPGYAAQMDVENDASDIRLSTALQERLTRTKNGRPKVASVEKALKSFQDTLIVVDNRDS